VVQQRCRAMLSTASGSMSYARLGLVGPAMNPSASTVGKLAIPILSRFSGTMISANEQLRTLSATLR
jgi:hypothetical protein